MLFNSYQFALFFAIVLSAYWLFHKHRRIQNILLLTAGYYFYACWNPKFLSLLIVSTVMDYACGIWVDRVDDPRGRRGVVALSMALNLGILCYFKYFNFFAESLQSFLAQLGWSDPAPPSGSRAADRHLFLHISIDELRHRRLPAPDETDEKPDRVCHLRLVLSAPGRGSDHEADDTLAAGGVSADV